MADSDTGYVHSIIPYYGKITGEVCNLPNSDKLFTATIVLSHGLSRVGGLKHAARQFILCGPRTDLVLIIECGPPQC
jgi:hypothetical protein